MTNFSTDVISTAIPFIVAILGLSIPLLLQVVARIDDKYSSVGLVDSFYKETKVKRFNYLLIAAIGFTLLSISGVIISSLFFQESGDCWKYFTYIPLAITTGFLIYYLFNYIGLIKIYYSPLKLQQHLHAKFKAGKQADQAFDALSELLYYSIRQQDEKLGKELYGFVAEYVITFRAGKTGEISYPEEFYGMLYRSNELIASIPTKLSSYYNGNTLLELLLDQYQGTRLSRETFHSLWVCLIQQAYHNRKDLIVSYWSIAHQYILLFRPQIYPVYSKWPQIVNKEEVNIREQERNLFLKFHYALGGVLLYLQKYEILQAIITYTNQKPPKYVLIPGTVGEIIKQYIEVEQSKLMPYVYSVNFPFPGLTGINSEEVIKQCIRKYLIILFLYQYVREEHLYGKSSFTLPAIPGQIDKLNFWKDELASLERETEDVLCNKELLEKAGLKALCNPEWFKENGKEAPLCIIRRLIDLVESTYVDKRGSVSLNENKIDRFKENARVIVGSAVKKISLLNNPEGLNDSDLDWYSVRASMHELLDRRAFAEESDICFIGTDRVIPDGVATNYCYSVTQTFNNLLITDYLIEKENVFSAIDRLGISAEDHVIICFGVDLIYYINVLNILALKKQEDTYNYKTIPIINMDKNFLGVEPDTIYIIKRTDLPVIELIDNGNPNQLTQVDDRYPVYADVLSFDKRSDLRAKYEKRVENIDTYVFASVELDAVVKWKKNVQCVSIQAYRQFMDSAMADKLTNIRPFPGS